MIFIIMNNNIDNKNHKEEESIGASGQSSISDVTNQRLALELASELLQLADYKEVTEDDLRKAIDSAKEEILENLEHLLERKWLVRHLIELRLRLQEYKEEMADPQSPTKTNTISNRTIKGHHLKLQPLLKMVVPPYCDHCTSTIWSLVQAWFMCEDCGYTCHYNCIGSIIRECAHVIACEKGEYELRICPEVGLSNQQLKCAECKTPFVLINDEWSDARLCDYNGLYYCSTCHWNGSAIIPARVVHNWDFEPRPVCQASLQLLKITATRPIINLENLNPQLFSQIQELELVKRLRQEIQDIKKYLTLCRKAIEERLLWKCEKPHLVENVDMYSLQDLVDTRSGDLPLLLHQVVDCFFTHIKTDCEICRGRGHICEICKNEDILFPFVMSTYVCETCSAVFHKRCMERNKREGCPRCIRLKSRSDHVNDNT